MISRQKFYAELRRLGFERAKLQTARNGTRYKRGGVSVTVPKSHRGTFHILGEHHSGGIYTLDSGRQWVLGTRVNPEDLGLGCLFEFCLKLLSDDWCVQKLGGEVFVYEIPQNGRHSPAPK